MLTRVLKRREYWRLIGTELEKVYKSLPKESKVLVVEQDGDIIGTWALIPYYHVECFGIKEGHRKKAGVVRGLFRKMFKLAKSLEIESVITGSTSDEMTRYLNRLHAVELPGKHFALGIQQIGE
jgi:hypothetical protein